MGNLVRKPAQILYNDITTKTVTLGEENAFLLFAEYNAIKLGDEILDFVKTSYAAGTKQVATVTPKIVHPALVEMLSCL